MTKNELAYDLTDGLYDAEALADELSKCRDAMARYFLSCDNENKNYCFERYETMTQLIEQIRHK